MTVRTPKKSTPFSLVYGCEAVLPMDIQIMSIRVTISTGMTDKEKHKQYLEQLKDLEKTQLAAQQQVELHQARISRAYNKKTKVCTLKKDYLVLVVRKPMQIMHKSKDKFQPK